MKQLIMLVDLDRCIGCLGGCQAACKTQNQIGLGPSRSKLYTIGPTGTYPDLQMYFMPVMCQQCANPSCVEACPTGACIKNAADGVIDIDKDICIGCQRCVKACPYDAVIFNKEAKVADKCNLCAGQLEEGEEPACVKNCSGKALIYGDKNDPGSAVAKQLAQENASLYSLPDQGNLPQGHFILRKAKWQEGLPQFTNQPKGCD